MTEAYTPSLPTCLPYSTQYSLALCSFLFSIFFVPFENVKRHTFSPYVHPLFHTLLHSLAQKIKKKIEPGIPSLPTLLPYSTHYCRALLDSLLLSLLLLHYYCFCLYLLFPSASLIPRTTPELFLTRILSLQRLNRRCI